MAMIQPAAAPNVRKLPLRRIRLPSATALLPYLRRIDEAQWYSNFGDLSMGLEARLAHHFRIERDDVLTVASGTAGLIASLQSLRMTPGKLCIMPSFTFIATAAAVAAAGFVPYFIDVERTSWCLEPDAVEAALANAPGEVAAVIPVSSFGMPIDVRAWDRFATRTGLEVIVDAAWAFDSLQPGESPAVVSLHATKVFGIGEGGLIIARDAHRIASARMASNFGLGSPDGVTIRGGNYKMSEYAAAVGHAALDAWPTLRQRIFDVSALYREALDGMRGVKLMPQFAEFAGATCAVAFDAPIAQQISERLARDGIESRLWWGRPCHTQPAYAGCPRGALPHTEWLAPRVLCLPFYADLEPDDVLHVRDSLRLAVEERG